MSCASRYWFSGVACRLTRAVSIIPITGNDIFPASLCVDCPQLLIVVPPENRSLLTHVWAMSAATELRLADGQADGPGWVTMCQFIRPIYVCLASCHIYCDKSSHRHAISLRPSHSGLAYDSQPIIIIIIIVTVAGLSYIAACHSKFSFGRTTFMTSLPKVTWEEGRVAVLLHTYAVKSQLVTMARPKFAPKTEYRLPWTDQ